MAEDNSNSDSNYFLISERDIVSETSLRLLSEARRSINILVYDYDDILLPSTDISELIATFIRHNERNRFRYLCSERALLQERGGKLIQLARRFSSFIKLKQLPDGMKLKHEQFIVIDDESSMQTQERLSHKYSANFNNRGRAHKLNNHFEELWQRSSAIPGVHVTGL